MIRDVDHLVEAFASQDNHKTIDIPNKLKNNMKKKRAAAGLRTVQNESLEIENNKPIAIPGRTSFPKAFN
jgi:hypothetical protein